MCLSLSFTILHFCMGGQVEKRVLAVKGFVLVGFQDVHRSLESNAKLVKRADHLGDVFPAACTPR